MMTLMMMMMMAMMIMIIFDYDDDFDDDDDDFGDDYVNGIWYLLSHQMMETQVDTCRFIVGSQLDNCVLPFKSSEILHFDDHDDDNDHDYDANDDDDDDI